MDERQDASTTAAHHHTGEHAERPFRCGRDRPQADPDADNPEPGPPRHLRPPRYKERFNRESGHNAELLRTARNIAESMCREWDQGLRTELRTCLLQWRFGDAMILAGELAARELHGCEGTVATSPFRLTEEWLDQRASEILEQWGALPEPRPARGGRGERLQRYGLLE